MAGLEGHLRGLSVSSSQLKQPSVSSSQLKQPGSSPVAGRPAVPLPTSAALVETQTSSPSRVKSRASMASTLKLKTVFVAGEPPPWAKERSASGKRWISVDQPAERNRPAACPAVTQQLPAELVPSTQPAARRTGCCDCDTDQG